MDYPAAQNATPRFSHQALPLVPYQPRQDTPSPMQPVQNRMWQTAPSRPDAPQYAMCSTGNQSDSLGCVTSSEGRPLAWRAKNAFNVTKDAEGKFQCPQCVKSYSRSEHLKRHFLRHTGERPYKCILCRGTFTRSDILKRHFQKCSILCGNPTGATHLSHAAAHVKTALSIIT